MLVAMITAVVLITALVVIVAVDVILAVVVTMIDAVLVDLAIEQRDNTFNFSDRLFWNTMINSFLDLSYVFKIEIPHLAIVY
jgi:hypothetical protein